MEFENLEGPLSEYLQELNEDVKITEPIERILMKPEPVNVTHPTIFEQEIAQQTLRLKGYYQKASFRTYLRIPKQLWLVLLLFWNYFWGFLLLIVYLIVSGTWKQSIYNYKLKSEFMIWKELNDELEVLMTHAIKLIKESEIVARGYRLAPRLIPIEHLEQQIEFQTSMELRNMVHYICKELLTCFHQLNFKNEEYSKGLQDRINSLEIPITDPRSLKYLKELQTKLIDSRICVLYYWNMNYKLKDFKMKLGSIYHIRMISKATKSLLFALKAILETQQSLLSPVQLSQVPSDSFESIYSKIHELHHKAILSHKHGVDKTEFVDFIQKKSMELYEATKDFTVDLDEDLNTRDVPTKKVKTEPVKDDTIDLDWNPKMELDTTEYQIGDAIDEQGLSDPIFPNEFTSELVQVLRKKKKL